MLEVEDKLNDLLRKPSYAKAAANTTSDSGIELKNDNEEDINEQENK